jgi:hypothetical protein
MPNKRIFYACHAVEVNTTTVQGAQSVSVNTNFNLEQVFQLGRLAIYDNITMDPDVEVTINKALDGHSTIWSLATGGGSIEANANDTCTIELGVGDETASALGANLSSIQMTGCLITSVNYTIPVDGNFTEEVTFVGSHKAVGGGVTAPTSTSPNNNVLRRQNLSSSSTLPSLVNPFGGKKLSQITISADFGREKMFSLGEASPFHRFVNFPLEVTASFDVIQDGNNNNILGGATYDIDELHNSCDGFDFDKEEIVVVLCNNAGTDIYTFDLGTGCALQSISYSGGDTGGGNVTETYTYVTYNELTITG